MPISVRCEQCQKTYRVSEEKLGKRIRCKNCQHVFLIQHDDRQETAEPVSSIASNIFRILIVVCILLAAGIAFAIWKIEFGDVAKNEHLEVVENQPDEPSPATIAPEENVDTPDKIENKLSADPVPNPIAQKETEELVAPEIPEPIPTITPVPVDWAKILQDVASSEVDQYGKQLKENEAVIEVTTLPDATIQVGSFEAVNATSLTISDHPLNKTVKRDLVVKFSDGSSAKKELYTQAGKVTRLSVAKPGTSQPQAVAAESHHSAPIDHIEYSSDGALLLSKNHTEVAVWDLASGRQIWRKVALPGSLKLATFCPDNLSVLTRVDQGESIPSLVKGGKPRSSSRAMIARWSLETGNVLETKSVPALVKGKGMYLANNLQITKTIAQLLKGKGRVYQYPISGHLPMARNKTFGWRRKPNDTVDTLVDVDSGAEVHSIVRSGENAHEPMELWAVNPRGDRLFVNYRDEQLTAYDLSGEAEPIVIKSRDEMDAILFAPDGSWVVVAEKSKMPILDATSLEHKYLLLGDYSIEDLTGTPSAMAASPDSEWLAASVNWSTYRSRVSSDKHNAIFIWDAKKGALVRRIDLPGNSSTIAFSPDQSHLCAVVDGTRLFFVPLETDEVRARVVKVEKAIEAQDYQIVPNKGEHGFAVVGSLADPDRPNALKDISFSEVERSRFGPEFHQVSSSSTGANAESQPGTVRSLAISPNGNWLATGLRQYGIKTAQPIAVVYNRKTLQRVQLLFENAALQLNDVKVRFSDDGLLMTASIVDGQLRFSVWNPLTGQKLRGSTCLLEGLQPYRPTISKTGRYVAAGCGDFAVVWDAISGMEFGRYPAMNQDKPSVYHVAFSDDEEELLVAEPDVVRFWKLRQRGDSPYEMNTGPLRSIAIDIDPKGERLLTTFGRYQSHFSKAYVWDLNRGIPIYQTNVFGHDDCFLSPDGTRMMLGETDFVGKDIPLINVDTSSIVMMHGRLSKRWYWNVSPFDPEGMHIVRDEVTRWGYDTAKVRGAVNAWTGEDEPGWWFDHLEETVRGHDILFCHSRVGDRLAVSNAIDSVVIFNSKTKEVVRNIPLKEIMKTARGGLRVLAMSTNGRLLAIGLTSTVLLYDLETGQRISLEHKKPRGFENTAAAKTDPLDMNDANLDTGSLEISADGSKLLARSTYPYPAGNKPLTTGHKAMAVIWDLETGKQLFANLEGSTQRNVKAGLSFDGSKVLLAAPENPDYCAGVWDLNAKELILKIPKSATRVCMSSDGTKVICSQEDKSVAVYDVLTGDELFRIFVFQDGWVAVTPEGFFDGSPSGRRQVAFQIGESVEKLPLERYFSKYYYPGLIGAVWNGQRPTSEGSSPQSQAPEIQILASNSGNDPKTATIDVAVKDQGGGLGIPWVTHNGVKIAEGKLQEPSENEETQVWRFSVALITGENKISANCSSENGLVLSKKAETTIQFDGTLDPPELYVLSIGINAYRDDSGVSKLDFCVSDANSIADLFRTRSNGVFENVHVKQLIDEQATRANILNSLGQFTAKCRPQDTLVVYIASHGLTLGQRFFVLPQEFRLPNVEVPEEKTNEDEVQAIALRGSTERKRSEVVRQQGLAVDQITDQLAQIPALRRVLIFDTCQSGGATQLIGQQNPFGFRGAVERSGQGVFVIAATAADELAAESQELGHSLLTYALLEAVGETDLAQPWIAPGSQIFVDEWFATAAQRVPALYKKYIGREQQIEVIGGAIGFPILAN